MPVLNDRPSSASPLLRRIVLAGIAMLLLGVAAGLAWLWLAEPARWQVTDTGAVLTETASTAQFSVIVVFVALGAVVSLAWGAFAAWTLDDLAWIITPFVVVLTALAAVVAWRVGVELGPPGPSAARGADVGDTIPAALKVDGLAPFLVWPIFGLVGVIVVVWMRRRAQDRSA